MRDDSDDSTAGTAESEAAYLAGVAEMYQGEVFGEALFSRMMELARTPAQRHKLANLLQLESETKVRLRPFVCALGVSVAESEARRTAGLREAERLSALPWDDFVATFHAQIHRYIERYTYIASLAPAAEREMLLSMVDHERILLSFLSRERAGMGDNSIEAVTEQLQYPLSRSH